LIGRRGRSQKLGAEVVRGTSSVAKWGLAISILTILGLAADLYVSHFRNAEHLEAGIVEYRLTSFNDTVESHSLLVDLALVNRGDVDARYVGSIMYVTCPPGSGSTFTRRPTADTKILAKPKSISGVELVFPPIEATLVRQFYAEAGLDTAKVQAEIALEVRALDTHGRLLSNTLRLREVTFWEYGISWATVETDSLVVEIIPGGHTARRPKGGMVIWQDAGVSFDPDGSVRNITFYPDSSAVESE
jgi:hypothetical protein